MSFFTTEIPELVWGESRSTLTRLEARVALADHVEPAATAYDFAVGVAVLEGLDGRDYFHFKKIIK